MTSHYQNQAYQQETAPTEHLQQNFGFSPAYSQQQQVPPYGSPNQTSGEYLLEASIGRPSAPYYPPTPPQLHQQPQLLFVSTHDAHPVPVPAYVQQQQVPPCPGGITAPYYNPNALPPPPPPPPTSRPRGYTCWDCCFNMNCLYLLLVIFGIAVPLFYILKK